MTLLGHGAMGICPLELMALTSSGGLLMLWSWLRARWGR